MRVTREIQNHPLLNCLLFLVSKKWEAVHPPALISVDRTSARTCPSDSCGSLVFSWTRWRLPARKLYRLPDAGLRPPWGYAVAIRETSALAHLIASPTSWMTAMPSASAWYCSFHPSRASIVGGLVAPALPADRVVEVAHAVRPLRVHESSSLRSSISPLVMYPSCRAVSAASCARSRPSLGAAARMASAARWQCTPS